MSKVNETIEKNDGKKALWLPTGLFYAVFYSSAG